MTRWLMLLLLMLWLPAQAAVEVLQFASPRQEQDYKTLINELRCLVCQNQNLADSNADLAKDLRHQTYDMIMRGKSKQDVVDYMVARYGDFVLYRPPLNSRTLLLWLGPLLLLLTGAALLWMKARGRSAQTITPDAAVLDKARLLLNHNKDTAP